MQIGDGETPVGPMTQERCFEKEGPFPTDRIRDRVSSYRHGNSSVPLWTQL